MAIYAIALLINEYGEPGARLISTDKGKCLDTGLSELRYYMSVGDGVKNLEYNSEGLIHWKQGSIERYPMLDRSKNLIKNQRNITVLKSGIIDEVKYFMVCDYTGRIDTVPERVLVEYAENNTLTNCKLVTKGKKKFISAIEGSIEELSIEPEFRINTETWELVVDMPIPTSRVLTIPKFHKNIVLNNIGSIKVTPEISGRYIRKLVIDNQYFQAVHDGMFRSMPNLEELEILADDVVIDNDGLSYLKHLKSVSINSVARIGYRSFSGLTELERVNIGKMPEVIMSNAFANCVKLDINMVLKEGIKEILTNAFTGCTCEEITIPSTVRYINADAFSKNNNLRKVDLKAPSVEIRENYGFGQKQQGLLANKNNIALYVNKLCNIDTNRIASNVSLLRREITGEEKEIELKVAKSKMVGANINTSEVLTRGKELADALILVPPNDLRGFMFKLVQKSITEQWRSSSDILECSGVRLRFNVGKPKKVNETKKIVDIGQYVMVTGRILSFYPSNRRLLAAFCESCNYGVIIYPAECDGRYVKSIDVSDSGAIRVIYENKGERWVETLDKYEIKDIK